MCIRDSINGGLNMATEKISLTDQLRNNIVTLRKELGISAYELSEKSNHSKYWLPNIESGKTQKIGKNDLFSIYKILLNDDDPESVFYYICLLYTSRCV